MTTNGTHNKDASKTHLLSPTAVCHFVLKTTPENHSAMIDFYLTFLGARITHRNNRIAFMTYDHMDHRLAIVQIPGLKPADPPGSNVGLAHTAFGFDTLSQLAQSYEEKKAHGILPVWCVNHGMSTSMYYRDPDGNEVETQVDNFDTPEEGVAFIEGESFAENPIGVDFDPEEFMRRVRSGEDEGVIKKRPDIGVRMTRMEKGSKQVGSVA